MKLHPAGNRVLWLECSCRLYKVKRRHCEHMAAMLLYLSENQPKKIEGLTSLPSQGRPKTQALVNRKDNVIERIVRDKLIKEIRFLPERGVLRLSFTDQDEQTRFIELDLDESARFLINHKDLIKKYADASAQKLNLIEAIATPGFRVSRHNQESIVVEKGYLLPDAFSTFVTKHRALGDHKSAKWSFLPIDFRKMSLGKDFGFIVGHGFFGFNDSTRSKTQFDDKQKRIVFDRDKAAELEFSNFASLIAIANIIIDEDLHATTTASSSELKLEGIDQLRRVDNWYAFTPRYNLGPSKIDIHELITYARTNRRRYFKTKDHWIEIPDWILEHDWSVDKDGMKLSASEVFRFFSDNEKYLKTDHRRMLFESIKERVLNKSQRKSTELDLTDTKLSLRPYQVTGVEWLLQMSDLGLGVLLADEMGLGKTHQAMGYFSVIKKEKPDSKFLVLCPTSVLDHWLDKLDQFCPQMKAFKYHGQERFQTQLAEISSRFDIILTSYGILVRDFKFFQTIPWHTILLDEAQAIKNAKTATFQSANLLQSSMKVCLSGTPIENNLVELSNIIQFLIPGYLGSQSYFRKQFIQPITSGDHESEARLQRLMSPVQLRRTKKLVLQDLPDKVEDIKYCHLHPDQEVLYRDILDLKAKPIIADLANPETKLSYLHVFTVIGMLKQICNHPYLLVKTDKAKRMGSEKFNLCKDIIQEALSSGHKIVVYSQYLMMLELFEEYFEKSGITYVKLTGQSKNRGRLVKEFQENPDTKIFLSSLLAGGLGIDLTAASVVIHYDRWWNAAKENQATDRVHRIGQNRNVLVYKLVTRGTLEERIDELINKKQTLLDKFVVENEDILKSLSRKDLLSLLSYEVKIDDSVIESTPTDKEVDL